MKVNDLKSRITYYKDKISEYAYHPYLSRYIKEPIIDEDKLLTYIHLFDYVRVEESSYDNYLMAVMFVQMALDTHDYVSHDNRETEVDVVRKRQLTVLAGDYYSGLYYHLLSLIHDLPFIQVLAKTIREVNEQKVRLYYGNHHSQDSMVQTFKNVETLLAYNVWCHFMTEEDSEVIVESIFVKSLRKWKENKERYFPQSAQAIAFAEKMDEEALQLTEEAHRLFLSKCEESSVAPSLCKRLENGSDQEIS
ncbi:heptaprenyl diphosphate synthase component 1 [Salimicrobium halophilum]|uniref:Heptaprenyl diphosphate synthase n=1 Tax=Salimicrobium halophilum TaxID=86666 RepID=A0A1G8Q0R4_9BACI|nr:heptaprenyl diphosphate synthase component 1 [Salimicrobium halophilum]SDI98106.1 heptaprenyl diphosphate synthase [Salimicrobium halophilum]